jgi:hypothetical protein
VKILLSFSQVPVTSSGPGTAQILSADPIEIAWESPTVETHSLVAYLSLQFRPFTYP